MNGLTHERLLQCLNYEPTTGIFTRLRRDWGGQKGVGQRAGKHNRQRGYRYVAVDGRSYMEHRLAWFYMTGNWPIQQIDHIDGVRDNNRFTNLREATSNQNHWNACRSRRNKSGYKGVSFATRERKWKADICVNYRHKSLGYYDTAEQAHAAYSRAARDLHGAFTRDAELFKGGQVS